MRYFKYPHQGRITKNTYKKRIALLDKKNKRNYYLQRILFCAVFALLFALAVGFILLLNYLSDIENISKGLLTFLQILVGGSIVIVPIAICVLLCILITKILPTVNVPQITEKVIEECTKPLKNYYKLNDNYIVTKCYESSDAQMINKDVILFVCDGKLRIVNNVSASVKDFGCYEISKEELDYRYGSKENLTTTVIKCEGLSLTLGKKAKPFISKNL